MLNDDCVSRTMTILVIPDPTSQLINSLNILSANKLVLRIGATTLVCPVHYSRLKHWTLVILKLQEKVTGQHFDSMRTQEAYVTAQEYVRSLVQGVGGSGKWTDADFILEQADCVQQENGVDCGIFTLLHVIKPTLRNRDTSLWRSTFTVMLQPNATGPDDDHPVKFHSFSRPAAVEDGEMPSLLVAVNSVLNEKRRSRDAGKDADTLLRDLLTKQEHLTTVTLAVLSRVVADLEAKQRYLASGSQFAWDSPLFAQLQSQVSESLVTSCSALQRRQTELQDVKSRLGAALDYVSRRLGARTADLVMRERRRDDAIKAM